MATGTDTQRVLEWSRIQERLAALASTPKGREQLSRLAPEPDFDKQQVALEFAQECLDLLQKGESLPTRPLVDLLPILERAAPEGAQMEGSELALAGDFCLLCTEVAAREATLPEGSPHLKALLGRIEPAPDFAREAAKALEPDGTVRDTASRELARLLRLRHETERELLATLEKTAQGVSSESVVTLREGRYVVSVPDRQKSQVPGIVHDRSQSGATYFIEPLTALEHGNRLRSADADIRHEKAAILRRLTAQLRALLPALSENLRALEELDLVWTKCRWAARLGGVVPRRTRESVLELKRARHPLLLERELDLGATFAEAQARIVPFAMVLGTSGRCLVISGPNTGGKTVCLKTVGLCVLLLQSGVPAPVSPDSLVGDFDQVFADIGDDQSLNLSLSTFSAHLKHVGEACRHATSRTLVLLDELGVGTDPEEGGALAQAVLEALLERGTSVVVTTHHPALKTFTPQAQVTHAAFAFHEEDLTPTYELLIGRPGRSYALEVAGRLGFPEGVVRRAKSLLSQEARDLSSLLDRLSKREREANLAASRLRDKETELDTLLAFNREAEARWQELSSRAEAEARSRAESIVRETRREVEHLVKEIRQRDAHPESVRQAQRGLSQLARASNPPSGKPARLHFEEGARVRLLDHGAEGEVVKVSKDGTRVSVRIGALTYTVAPDRLAAMAETASGPGPAQAAPSASHEPHEIDVRGLSADEAVFEVEAAVRALGTGGGRTLYVIHGLGTGVLRRDITAWLKRSREVASFRKGGPGEGSGGVTVVTLK